MQNEAAPRVSVLCRCALNEKTMRRTQDAGPEAPQRAFPHRSPPADVVLKPILNKCSSCIWFC